ncbi:MAG: DHH family phosphoesterase [Kiritimatiellae bacterium]|nr:DHH family phosphoesterase [Kiritimatiellia bacterium]
MTRRILARRGIAGEAALDEFLDPSLSRLARPGDLPGISAAVDETIPFLASGRKIVVFGDYDCDGVCASAILVKTLSALGADASAFVPDRAAEGYGMNAKSVARMLREHPGVALAITVDNGVNAVDEVAALVARGIHVIVTDHHLPGATLPGCTVVNPKVAAPPSLEPLCGAGVAFFFACALANEARARGMYSGGSLGGAPLVLAGLATVTDIMPLVGQNRIIVSESLKYFGRFAPAGLRELHQRAARTGAKKMCARDYAFLLGPRLNAAGRMASATEALELVLCDDREKARERACAVDRLNTERKTAEKAMVDAAAAKISAGALAQVIELEDGNPGVAGIVASKILEATGVPVCIVVDGRGSARAPEGYNLPKAFAHASSALERFGGHAAAGGFSVKAGRLDEFRRLFAEACGLQRAAAGPSAPEYDLEVAAEELDIETVGSFRLLEPFGVGNPEPVFMMRGKKLCDLRRMGDRHLCFTVDGVRAVWWGQGEKLDEIGRLASGADILFSARISEYGGDHVEFDVSGVAPATES